MTGEMLAHRDRAISACLVTIALVYILVVPEASIALQQTKITLSTSNNRPLRGEVLKVEGRLSTVDGDTPIPLVTVRLQYHRLGEVDVIRDVTTVTSNPGGTFEDLVNTTNLLRIGTWIVNGSFASRLDYEGSSTVEAFTIVVQPTLSFYLSTHTVTLGKNITFDGLLFACIPCIHDHVTVMWTRPDNTSVAMTLPINATGGPYPGGYYGGAFIPDMSGRWHVEAVWEGNEVMLPTRSQVEEFNVETASAMSLAPPYFYWISIVALIGALVLLTFRLWKFAHERRAVQ